MNLRLIQIRDFLADSFWFLPALMALLAGGASGARGVLSVVAGSVVAGSVITVVSIVFSFTISGVAPNERLSSQDFAGCFG